MNVSANTLFHFTNDIETIKSILNDKFYGGYCKEVLEFKGEKLPLFIPMISFCDLRLETISRFTKYGKFGLGLTKEWGIRNKLNPVFYLEKKSLLAESLLSSLSGSLTSIALDSIQAKQIEQKIQTISNGRGRDAQSKQQILTKLNKDLIVIKSKTKPIEHFIYSLYYTKHYEAVLERENGITNDYRFYDEREWRYIPEFDCAVCQLRRKEKDYLEWRSQSVKKPLLKEVSLLFDFPDIEYIIVEKENQVQEMIDFINNLSDEKCDQKQKNKLLTKIISFEKFSSNY